MSGRGSLLRRPRGCTSTHRASRESETSLLSRRAPRCPCAESAARPNRARPAQSGPCGREGLPAPGLFASIRSETDRPSSLRACRTKRASPGLAPTLNLKLLSPARAEGDRLRHGPRLEHHGDDGCSGAGCRLDPPPPILPPPGQASKRFPCGPKAPSRRASSTGAAERVAEARTRIVAARRDRKLIAAGDQIGEGPVAAAERFREAHPVDQIPRVVDRLAGDVVSRESFSPADRAVPSARTTSESVAVRVNEAWRIVRLSGMRTWWNVTWRSRMSEAGRRIRNRGPVGEENTGSIPRDHGRAAPFRGR